MTTTIGSLDLNAFSDLYNDSNQYFWFESNASATYGAGVHVTLVPDTTFINNPTGQNILMNTDGFSIRNGLLPMMTLDNDSLDFNAIDTTTGTYVTTATFTATGVQIGQSGAAHSIIDANGQRFYGGSNGTTQLANIGYGEGQAQTGTAIAPYYTFGTRSSTTVGNYSVVEGRSNNATGANSHAEGWTTIATGANSHAEGFTTRATGAHSHAEGGPNALSSGELISTTASGGASHAEGWGTTASGAGSHSQNDMTIASKSAQTALGTYNIEDTASTTTHPNGYASYGQYAVIVGNGTSSARSNALTVEWNGRVSINNVSPISVASNDEAYIKIRHSSIDSDGTAPSSSVYSNNLHSFDTDGTRIGYTESVHNTDNEICMNIGASREVNGSMVYNSITAKVSASGEQTYAMASPTNFRKAIKLKDAFKFKTATKANQSYTAGGLKTVTITDGAKMSNCTPIAIRGWNINNSSSGGVNASGINVFSCMISGDDVVLETKNNASSAAKVDFYVYVTFIENY